MINEAFLSAMAARMFGGTHAWGDYTVRLGRADIQTLTPRSSAEAFLELNSETNHGYAPADAELSVENSSEYGINSIFSVANPAYVNTGSTPWERTGCIFVMSGALWIYAVPLNIILGASDTFTPWGRTYGDNCVILSWRCSSRGESY